MKDPSNSPQNVQHTAADTRRLHFWVPNLSRFLGMAILAATVAWIVVLLADVRQPWIHPELVEVPPLLWSRLPHTFVGQLRGIFEWSWFEPNPSRLRLVSDLFQVLDAMTFPLVGRVFTITSLGNVTTMLLFTLTPWFFFRVLRIWSFTLLQAQVLTAVLISSTGFLSVGFAYIRPAKPLALTILVLLIYSLSKYILQSNSMSLWYIGGLSLLGMLTDETLFWALPFALVVLYAN